MRDFLRACRSQFVHAGLFSLCINVLLLTLPLYMLQVFDRVLGSRSTDTLLWLTVAAIVALLILAALDALRARLLLVAGVALDGMLGPRVLTGLLATAARPGGNPYVHGLRDVAVLRNFLTGQGIFSLFDAPWAPIYIAVTFMFSPVLGLIALAGAVLLAILAWVNEKATRPVQEEMQVRARKAGRFIDISLRNAEAVAALGMLPGVRGRWEALNDQVIAGQMEAGRRGGSIGSLTKFVRLSIQIVMLGAGAYLVIAQHLTPGVMMAATLILARALAPVEMAIANWKGLIEARAAYRRLDELMKESPEDAIPTALPPPQGRLSVEKAVFAVRAGAPIVLKGVSFELAAGESLGLVGPTAAGKSTLARLITGVWRPVSGAIRLDGADVAKWDRTELGRHMGYLPQDVELFSGTVAENIARLGEPDSEAVVGAAKRAHAHEMILRLPNGYDTDLGEGGTTLSGGQRQRIALARALFGNPRLVVLDEPNANLDSEGEDALLKALAELKEGGVTTVVITHRPSLVAGVDKLLVLREGAVEMMGPRAEVMARLAARPGAAPEGGAASLEAVRKR